jgi:hypothetical protein
VTRGVYHHRPNRASVRRLFPHAVLLVLIGATCVLLVGLLGCSAYGRYADIASPTIAPATISEDRAVALAREHVNPPTAVLSEARLGRFGDISSDVVQNPNVMTGPGVPAADMLVWGVVFNVDIQICPPQPNDCYSRPGSATVILNPATGEWIATYGVSPHK